MASSKLLLNLSGTFLCSYRTSSPSSRRLFPLYPFSPLTKFQSSLRLCTSAAATLSVDSDPSPLSDPSLHAGHPWPEWDSFVNKLKTKGYFDRATTITGEGDAATVLVEDATTETNQLKNACLKFGRERFDILSTLPKQDLEALVKFGCPSLFRKAVNSSKRLRAFLQIDEGDACGVCKLRGSCDKAYVAAKDEQVARTVDVIRVLLTYALEPSNLSGDESVVKKNVQESARSLLAELIRLSDTMIDPSLPKPVLCNVSSKKEVSHQSVGVEMKKGDWLCPKCNFMNFARNMRCLECKEAGPREAGPSDIQMKPGDWNCPKCQFMNFSRNKACFRCEEPHKRELNFGEWQCPSCDYVNFRRNQECRKCNCERPEETGGDQSEDRLWQNPKQSFRKSNFKFGDDSDGTEGEDGGMSTFDGYRLRSRKRDGMATRRS
ncbi:zinc finger protein VAR3 [Carex littledalei]|uniref:Zinc finger protein VAR3 n=1 Tax=Carex littledalei TaxID=544730 RepID=A0A833QEE3_9POAL|nr:zinc finger protein VAR3 [Carex littledalei]